MVVTRILLKARPAFGAKAFAVLPAHRLERQGSYHCVPQNRFKIDYISLDPALLFFLFFFKGLSVLVVEEFLHIDVLVVLDGNQAPSALPLDGNKCGTRDQDPLVYSFEPQIELNVRSERHANKRNTEVFRCRHMLMHCPHGSRAAPEILDINCQGGTRL